MKFHSVCMAASLVVAGAVASPVTRERPPTYFFTFGDSYSMTSFNIYGVQPTPGNPMGNPALGTGTTGGGINWIGDLTAVDNETLILSYNLAVGGATLDNQIINAGVEDMTTQVATFLSYYGDKPGIAPWASDDTVFGFWIGINDVGWAYSSQNATTIVPMLMAQYKSLVEQIYAKGGRKFLFLNVPPTSRSPFILEYGLAASQEHAAWLAVFNEYLKLMILGFQDEHPEVKTMLYNSWNFMTKILDNPTKYHYPNSTCIDSDGTTCIWWNSYHPGLKYHALQAADMKSHLEPFGAW